MTHSSRFGYALVLACLCGMGAVANAQTTQTNEPTVSQKQSSPSAASEAQTAQPRQGAGSTEALTDQEFVNKAMQSNLLELRASTLVQKGTEDPQVEKFARTIIADHTRAAAMLKTLAREQNLQVPTKLDASHERQLKPLIGLSGAALDAAYSGVMASSHDRAVQLFQQASRSEQLSADLRQYAEELLPTLKAHNQMAGELHQREARAAELPATGEQTQRR